MDDFFKIVAAGPAFFLSAWLLMLFAGITSTDIGVRPFGYVTSMIVTIGLWLTRPSDIWVITHTRARLSSRFTICDHWTCAALGSRQGGS